MPSASVPLNPSEREGAWVAEVPGGTTGERIGDGASLAERSLEERDLEESSLKGVVFLLRVACIDRQRSHISIHIRSYAHSFF